MSAPMIFMVALVTVLILVVVALTYRLWKLRQGGTAAILRDTPPAVGGHGWRHGGSSGIAVTKPGSIGLSSLRWWPDRRLSRRGLEVISRRARAATSSTSCPTRSSCSNCTTPPSTAGADTRWRWIAGALTAFLSWVESSPSPRARRRTA